MIYIKFMSNQNYFIACNFFFCRCLHPVSYIAVINLCYRKLYYCYAYYYIHETETQIQISRVCNFTVLHSTKTAYHHFGIVYLVVPVLFPQVTPCHFVITNCIKLNIASRGITHQCCKEQWNGKNLEKARTQREKENGNLINLHSFLKKRKVGKQLSWLSTYLWLHCSQV
jgi:hypothetical protein